MQLIFGFGNPGSEYNFTRHNYGFLALDFYAKRHNLTWTAKPKFFAEVAEDHDNDLLLIKPQTFYNDIGKCVQAYTNFYKLQPQDILILCDDFHLDFGSTRFRERGSAGGNNGLKSVINYLHTDDFPRYRLGTGNDTLRARIGDIDFVLSKFTDKERGELPQVLAEIEKFILNYK